VDIGGKYVPTRCKLIERLKYFCPLQNVRCIPDVLLRHEQEICEIIITAEIFVLRKTANYNNRKSRP